LGQVTVKNRSSQFQHRNKFTFEKDGNVLVLTVDYQLESFVNDYKKTSKSEYTCRLEDKNGPKPAPKQWYEKEWPAKDWNPEVPIRRTESIPNPEAEVGE
jgi:hypothetical protein